MRKCLKKVVPLFVMLIFAMMASLTVEAKTITSPEQILTLYSKSSKAYSSFLSEYSAANKKVLAVVPASKKITSIKSTNKSVVTLSTSKGKGLTSGKKGIFLNVKKAGTATVSYKVGSNTYRTKIIVKKYVSPASSLKLGKSNLSSKFKSKSVYIMSYAKYKNKSFNVIYKPKKDWSVTVSYLRKPGNQKANIVKNNKSFKVTNRNSALILDAFNLKTKQNEECLIIFK